MKHLTKFSTEELYNASPYPKEFPNVSSINGDDVRYQYIWKYEYFTLHALESGTITITIPATVTASYATYIEYSKTKQDWIRTYVGSAAQTITINVDTDDRVHLRGQAKAWALDGYSNFTKINSTCNINVYGNIASLINPTLFYTNLSQLTNYQCAFAGLFKNNSHIISAKNLILEYNYNNMYHSMFGFCTSLQIPPKLPATTLYQACYASMFSNCTSLKIAPELPATTLAASCYINMFAYCSSLVIPPKLPAITLAASCYSSMFADCTSLKIAPKLPATTLAASCYTHMFEGCNLTAAPDLLATTLVNNCYERMFAECNRLKYIKAMFTTEPSDTYTSQWMDEVAENGTFVKNSAATWTNTGVNAVLPTWTVQTANS